METALRSRSFPRERGWGEEKPTCASGVTVAAPALYSLCCRSRLSGPAVAEALQGLSFHGPLSNLVVRSDVRGMCGRSLGGFLRIGAGASFALLSLPSSLRRHRSIASAHSRSLLPLLRALCMCCVNEEC